MTSIGSAPRPTLVVGDPSGGSVTFGPLFVRDANRENDDWYNAIAGPIVVVAADGTRHELRDGNGIEPFALALLRNDLGVLQRERRGSVCFGDHDRAQLVELAATDRGVVRVSASIPQVDEWDIQVTEVAFDQLGQIIEQIDNIEAAFGPLVGHCSTCGTPTSGYRE